MIKKLTGKIIEKEENEVIIDVDGIGFEVFCSDSESFELGHIYSLYIFEDRKEDELNLFGFINRETLDFFTTIVHKISGVGPKTAMNILSTLSLEEIKEATTLGDYKPFLKVKGLGEKTAKRIVLEIGGEVNKLEEKLNEKLETVLDSLVSLGFDKKKAMDAIKTLDKNKDVEELIKEGIKKLSDG